jgi:thiol-disulfide isomerase/thioredoxin
VLAERMPPFVGVSAWLNTWPLTPETLKGKVVLVDFWTYSCINCIRTLPYLTSWQRKYGSDGFTVVGVHTPEFAFEKDEANVTDAMRRFGITYPVALDNGYGTWDAYANRYWPAHYLFDAQGRLRMTHFGEGKYAETEAAIRALLAEAGLDATGDMTEEAPGPDFGRIKSPETYVGYARQDGFASPEGLRRDAAARYTVPGRLAKNEFALAGEWTVGAERASLGSSAGAIAFRYDAAAANLVMGAPVPVRAEVTLDGVPVPAAYRGADVVEEDGRTYVEIGTERLYSLIDGDAYEEHLLRIDFLGAGVDCYAWTFG